MSSDEFSSIKAEIPRGSELSEDEQAQIRALHEEGVSNRGTAEQLCRAPSTIDNFVRDPDSYGQRQRSGRPKKLSPQEERLVGRLVSNSMISINGVRASLSTPVSRMTVWKAIKRNGNIVRCRLRPAPRLTQSHKDAWPAFARKNMATDWSKVIFSDEKKFNLDGPDGNGHYWRDLYRHPLVFSKRNFGGGTVMVWGGFYQEVVLDIAFVSTRTNSSDYEEMLGYHLLPFLDQHSATPFILAGQRGNPR
ncbi:hypothetical protein Y032_0862g2739 [Ancylostoma ceylanicum]|uniref:Uncharacterized protein n=1 Tax=Ancylostoma ceylanicum TaxID=53326 RepID=A0A016WAR5_9BILA|nr:hypothetical protein Y032_0862g2739 [Ancylostoma ceylanicum]